MGNVGPSELKRLLAIAWDVWELEPLWRNAVLVAVVGTLVMLVVGAPPASPPSPIRPSVGGPSPSGSGAHGVQPQPWTFAPRSQGTPQHVPPSPRKKVAPTVTQGTVHEYIAPRGAPSQIEHAIQPGHPTRETRDEILSPSLPSRLQRAADDGKG